MTLHAKQVRFARLLASLIQEAERQGYEVTLGEAYRPPETAALYAKQGRGIAASLHTDRLAVDLNLFRDGLYCPDTESFRPLGEFWKSLSPECAWGGDFRKPDGGHFSLRHMGLA